MAKAKAAEVKTRRATRGPETPVHGVDERIRRDITAAIFDQKLPPGTRLSEVRLGEIYGVSRTVVRRALIRLAGDRLVDNRRNHGVAVAQPTLEEAHEVFEARWVIEPALLADSMATMTRAGRERLARLLDADKVASDGDQPQQIIGASGGFHLGLARLAHNTVLCDFLEHLIGRTSIIIAMYGDNIADACFHPAHAELAALVKRGDIAAAQEAMRAHLRETEAQLGRVRTPEEPDLAAMLGRTGRGA